MDMFLIASVVVAGANEQSAEGFKWMPVPSAFRMTQGTFRLDTTFTVSVEGAATLRQYRAAARMLRRLSDRTGLFFSQNILSPSTNPSQPSMSITASHQGRLEPGEDESYTLEISGQSIRLSAESDIGTLRGMETFLQLLDADGQGYFFPCVSVEDRPRFSWRGLLIDAGRHFMPVDVILRNLDGMATVKLNVLHWHLTDDQGFRVECKTHPKLHELGSDGQYYTHEQIRRVVAYAADRGIRVMPEFDIPGHSTAWFVGYPELASASGQYEIERHWGVFKPTMDPTRGSTYNFLDGFFKEMAGLFPDAFIHIGGDEVEGSAWKESPAIQAFMKKNHIPDNHALQTYFNLRIQKILVKHGKRIVGWGEILNSSLRKDAVIHSWRERKALATSAKQGYQTILSNGYYIDLMQTAEMHYLNDPLTPELGLSEAEAKNVLGGEATMWGEYVVPETIDSRIWPRTAAIAERLWSPADVRDVDDMLRRLNAVRLRLEEDGLTHDKNQAMMLRRLAAGADVQPLKVFVDAVEPVKNYRRGFQREYTSFSPMTRVVDAAQPDSPAREFNRRVGKWLGCKVPDSTRASICTDLARWKENHGLLLPMLSRSPILQEIESLSQDLAVCSTIGLEALRKIETGEPASDSWIQDQKVRLQEARKPRGQVELVVIDGIERLVEGKKGTGK